MAGDTGAVADRGVSNDHIFDPELGSTVDWMPMQRR